MDLRQLLRADWLGLNAVGRRNALVAAAAAARRAHERDEADRTLRASARASASRGLRRAL